MIGVFKIFWHQRYQKDISTSSFNCELLLKPMISTTTKNPLKKGGLGYFKHSFLRRDFSSFWSNTTIRIFNTTNISEFCYSSGWHFLQKPQMCGFNDNTNQLKTRENHIVRVRRCPSFNLHSGFSFKLSKNICRAYICTLPSPKFLTNQTIWGIWTWDFGSVLLKIKRLQQCLSLFFVLGLGNNSNFGICTGR